MIRRTLPVPECPWGYTKRQILDIMGPRKEDRDRFYSWMRGQTVMLCEGKSFNHELKISEPDVCAPDGHGEIVYVTDVRHYLAGLPPLD